MTGYYNECDCGRLTSDETPCRRCLLAKIRQLQAIVDAIDELRAEVGDSLEILSDCVSRGTEWTTIVTVSADWLSYLPQQYHGATLADALDAAVRAKREAAAAAKE